MDAVYEGAQKRTFLAMSICISCNFALLLGFMLLYLKLGELIKRCEGDGDDEENETNETKKTYSDSDNVP